MNTKNQISKRIPVVPKVEFIVAVLSFSTANPISITEELPVPWRVWLLRLTAKVKVNESCSLSSKDNVESPYISVDKAHFV